MRKLRLEELGRDSIEEFQMKPKMPIVVVLDDIRSGHNVGSLFRTADAFNIEKIILCGITPQPPHREILKTAIGSTHSVVWEYDSAVSKALGSLREDGYLLIGVEQTDESRPLSQDLALQNKKVALVFGNEVNGLNVDILEHLDECWEIQQYGTKHSLNVSVCAGIVIWETFKALSR